ncbi:MAG: hypothetical protein AVDCRST_MAG62-1496 [uncultured Sphingomonas sp.]|uniref:Uncharacterized protein n=1 Tax=uncultured Sphingomonas sp. TaxID=158754 RepID=A0A6J4TLB0_9SPHN|nr:MAG: hypothetical protein AVDCRST_MAG62-1496 [uncultured Sphingomonas sp.]
MKSPLLDFAVSWRLCRTGGTLDGWQEIQLHDPGHAVSASPGKRA